MYPFGMYDGYGLGYGLGMIPSAPQPPAFKTEGRTDAFVNHYEESGIDPTVALLSFTALSALGGLLIARKFNKTTKIVDNVTQKWTAAAKERAGKITAEATDKAAAHIEGAKAEAAAHAEGVIAEAENNAAGIISDAETHAKGLTDEAEAAKAEAARLRTEAEDAKASAEAYKNVTSTMAEADRDMAAKNLRSAEFAKKAATDGLKKARADFAEECAKRDAELAERTRIVQDSIAQDRVNLEKLEGIIEGRGQEIVKGEEELARKQEELLQLEEELFKKDSAAKKAIDADYATMEEMQKELLAAEKAGRKDLLELQAKMDTQAQSLATRETALAKKYAEAEELLKDIEARRATLAKQRAEFEADKAAKPTTPPKAPTGGAGTGPAPKHPKNPPSGTGKGKSSAATTTQPVIPQPIPVVPARTVKPTRFRPPVTPPVKMVDRELSTDVLSRVHQFRVNNDIDGAIALVTPIAKHNVPARKLLAELYDKKVNTGTFLSKPAEYQKPHIEKWIALQVKLAKNGDEKAIRRLIDMKDRLEFPKYQKMPELAKSIDEAFGG